MVFLHYFLSKLGALAVFPHTKKYFPIIIKLAVPYLLTLQPVVRTDSVPATWYILNKY